MPKRMVFGDDGSPGADSAWLWINSHDWPGWTIEVLVALEGRGGAHVRPAARSLLRPQVAGGLTEEVVHADPRHALHTRAAIRDLVVVGTRGRGLLKALHLGSTAEWLLHEPAAPTVFVRGGHRTQRVLLAHDGSADAQAAEDALLAMPWIGDAEVLVVSVADHQTQADPVIAAALTRLAGSAATVRAQVLAPTDLQVFYRPRDLILDMLEEWKADLVAMGSRGVSAWESANEIGLRRAGSTASAIARHAPCSLLLAKA
jgi:nucleotide-binding universal stress UspA family protein